MDFKIENDNVIVMNSKTWEVMKKNTIEVAEKQSDPIGFIGRLSGLDIIIDEDVADGMTEVWDKGVYEAFKSFKE
ncbi:hypothetical protein PQE74_gp215 [Bacillus phage vB_BanS_Chewbecca]|uniref:Uncharacterized protein n=2 Tax=Tsamsavirus TaxID=3044849 RepID=A0AAE8YYC1_9CAUD|nr:hypothetical protein PQE72_gp006 [Bacillus phage vB_BanS_Skywalker]YP_010681375.1 hypothetical protein PQE74_gp215 [Bacillus phage vB_BanS_Chewbecca]UGO46315.1 hypothetical protein CHEWBECCA_252 [Bacillus phage vB_BanS_Chewbecca]UGO51184.1 hypothetical protein SKYWALKER_6 [Bacillus phage vB_BanS_Skywalker]